VIKNFVNLNLTLINHITGMKRILALSACLSLCAIASAQHVYHLPSVQPDNQNFKNTYILPLDSDSLTSSFIIWSKNEIAAHYHRYHTEQILVMEGTGIMQFGDQRIVSPHCTPSCELMKFC
jgi:hypothetical protein